MIDSQKEKIRTYFGRISDEYLRACGEKELLSVRSYIFSWRKRYVLDMFDLKGGRVLDIGCGPAVLTEELLKNGCEVWGIDISEAMIERANKKMQEAGYRRNFHFSVGDSDRLDFPDGYFDFILCIGVLEYLRDESFILKEIERVLKSKGKVIITVPNAASPFVFLDRMALIAARIFRLPFKAGIMGRYYLPPRLNKVLVRNGFEINKTTFHAFRSAVLNSISPKLALFFIRKLEFLANSPLRFMGINYIVKAQKR